MPKITRLGGVSDANNPEPQGLTVTELHGLVAAPDGSFTNVPEDTEPLVSITVGGEQPSPGSSSETSSPKPGRTGSNSSRSGRKPARTTASPSRKRGAASTAASADDTATN